MVNSNVDCMPVRSRLDMCIFAYWLFLVCCAESNILYIYKTASFFVILYYY